MNSTQQWNPNHLNEMPLTPSIPKVSQPYIIRKSYNDIIRVPSLNIRGGNNLAPDLSVKVEINSQPSQRLINFLKCLSILSSLPENALEEAVFQLEHLRKNDSKQSIFLQPLDLKIHWQQAINLSAQQSSTNRNKYSSSPDLASLVVGSLEKDYENLCSNHPKTIEITEKLIDILYSVALKNNWWWYNPLLNISFDNEIVLEWWNQSKKITIYVSEEAIDYIKVWGADLDNEMEDGSISLEDDLADLWQWIAT